MTYEIRERIYDWSSAAADEKGEKMTEEIKLRPLGKLMNLIEESGYKLEYQFDDLVFVDNTAFLFQFDAESAEHVLVRFNTDCDATAKEKISEGLLAKSKEEDVKLVLASDFKISQVEGKEEFEVKFM